MGALADMLQPSEFRGARMVVEIDSHFDTITFIVFFMLNFLILGTSTSGVPIKTMFPLLVLWFGISVPLVFLEAYFAV